jgi:hypothetical protein
MEVRRNHYNECALELERDDTYVTSLRFKGGSTDSGLGIFRDGIPVFDREYSRPVYSKGLIAGPVDFARVHLRDTVRHFAVPEDVLDTLRGIMALSYPERLELHHMYILVECEKLDTVGFFEHHDDARIVAYSFMFSTYLIGSPEDLEKWPLDRLLKFRDQLYRRAGDKPPPLRPKDTGNIQKLSTGVWEMAKQAKNPPVTKPATVAKKTTEKKVSTKRSDGPCGQVHAYLDANKEAIKSGTLTKKAVVAALVAKGVNSSTAGIQAGKWVKKNPGYDFLAPVKAEKAPKAAKEPKAPAAKKAAPAAKKATTVKKTTPAAKKAKTATAQAAA